MKFKLIILTIILLIFSGCGESKFTNNISKNNLSINSTNLQKNNYFISNNSIKTLNLNKFQQKIGEYIRDNQSYNSSIQKNSNSYFLKYYNQNNRTKTVYISFIKFKNKTIFNKNLETLKNSFFKTLNNSLIKGGSTKIIILKNNEDFDSIIITSLFNSSKITNDFIIKFPINKKLVKNLNITIKKNYQEEFKSALNKKIEQQSNTGSKIIIERLETTGFIYIHNEVVEPIKWSSIKINSSCNNFAGGSLSGKNITEIKFLNCSLKKNSIYNIIIDTNRGTYSSTLIAR